MYRWLRRWWRRLEGDARIQNEDLPACVLQLMEGLMPPNDFVSNGCSFSPDRVFGVDIRAAGHMHDFAYSFVQNERDRKDADYRFFRNLRRCGLSRFLARKYFYRVRFWGAGACDYSGNSSARPSAWERAKLFFSRYVEW